MNGKNQTKSFRNKSYKYETLLISYVWKNQEVDWTNTNINITKPRGRLDKYQH